MASNPGWVFWAGASGFAAGLPVEPGTLGQHSRACRPVDRCWAQSQPVSLAIGGFEFVTEIYAEELFCPEFSQVDDLQDADDLIYCLVSLGFMLLSSHLFCIEYKVFDVPYSHFVACDHLSLPGNAQLLGDCSRSFFIAEACFHLVDECSYGFEGH